MGKNENFDIRQKEAINGIENVVVSAGAGSGKTSVLSARFVNLVTKYGYKAEEILTLTFTRKASVEMKGRIFKNLKETSEQGETKTEKARALEAVKNFDKAYIGTLDSYCSNVARQGAHFYGISPDFSTDDGTLPSIIEEKAFKFVLENRDEPVIKELSSKIGLQEVAKDLFAATILNHSSIASPIDFFSGIEKQKKTVVEEWNKNGQKLDSLIGKIKFTLENEDCGTGKTKTNIEEAVKIINLDYPEISEEAVEKADAQELLEYLSQFKNIISVRKPGNSKSEGLLLIAEYLPEIKENIIPALVSHGNFILNYRLILNAAKLLTVFQDEVNSHKRISGIFSFNDIAHLARKTLLEHPEIRRIEKDKYKAIMIDEFQDDNQLQCDLLFLLAEKDGEESPEICTFSQMKEKLNPKKLFFVGDEKQSIYRFRGADVSVFRNLKDNIGKNINLETNYRSDCELIEFFNTVFGGNPFPSINNATDSEENLPSVFMTRKNTDFIPDYQAEYETVLVPEFKKKKIEFPLATIALYEKEKEVPLGMLNEYQNEAFWTQNEIERIIREEKKPDGNPYTYSDFAVLFRTFSHIREYEEIFLANNVPYTTDAFKGIFADGPTNDIYSYICLCAYPNETLPYAKLLTSPLVNLSTQSMEKVLSMNLEIFSEEAEKVLEGNERENFHEAGNIFRKISPESKTLALSSLISKIWYELGYRYETLWNKKVQMFQSLYDMLFELARLAEEKSQNLAAFVDTLRIYQNDAEKLDSLDAPFESSEGVKFMSIHASKGLQFPVVFVSGVTNRPLYEKNDEAVYMSDKYGVTFNLPVAKEIKDSLGEKVSKKPNYFYDEAKTLNSLMTNAELRRIAYVAFTRAVNKLYITGTFSGEIKQQPAQMRIFDIIAPAIISHTETVEKDDGTNEIRAKKTSPFNFVTFRAATRNDAFSSKNGEKVRNDFEGKLSFIRNEENRLSKATIIKKEKVIPKYVNPSLLEERTDESENPSNQKKIPYMEINEIVDSSDNGRFGYSDFGTIAHSFIESRINGLAPVLEEKYFAALDNSESKIRTIKNAAEKMADSFIQSPLGKEAKSSKEKALLCKAEYDFRSCIKDIKSAEKIIVKGQMDLVFENVDKSEYDYTIVDYKTDQEIKPEIYINQISSYRQAISAMLHTSEEKIRCVLFYLRYAKAVDITKECSDDCFKEKIDRILKESQ